MNEGTKQQTAAAAAGMCERSARDGRRVALSSETKSERHWRTRKDPFGEVWEAEIVPSLKADERSVLEGTTAIAELRRRHGDIYGVSQLRTLQRPMNEGRTLHGLGKEVYFEQRPAAGREAAFDFTETSRRQISR